MNRFRPHPDRVCLEDLSAPVSHFAACRQNHEYMYRQLVQTHRREPQMDPGFWDRTANIWAGNATRARAGLVQLAADFYGKCTTVAVLAVLAIGMHVLPLPGKSTPTTASPTSAKGQTAYSQSPPLNTAGAARSNPAASVQSETNSAASSENVPASPVQASTGTNVPRVPAETVQPVPADPAPTTPTSSQPSTEVHVSDEQVSVSVLSSDEPTVAVSLPGVSVNVL